MPAGEFTKKATSPKLKRMWREVYESAKKKGDGAASAIRKANAAVKKASK